MTLYVTSNNIVKYTKKLRQEKEKVKNRKLYKKIKIADDEEVITDYFG